MLSWNIGCRNNVWKVKTEQAGVVAMLYSCFVSGGTWFGSRSVHWQRYLKFLLFLLNVSAR
jgi:hypothetical protein